MRSRRASNTPKFTTDDLMFYLSELARPAGQKEGSTYQGLGKNQPQVALGGSPSRSVGTRFRLVHADQSYEVILRLDRHERGHQLVFADELDWDNS